LPPVGNHLDNENASKRIWLTFLVPSCNLRPEVEKYSFFNATGVYIKGMLKLEK